MLRDDLKSWAFRRRSWYTRPAPRVWGYYDAGAEKTLMVYLMYDVQPVIPRTGNLRLSRRRWWSTSSVKP